MCKRLLDVTISLVIIMVFMPILIFLAIVVRSKLGSPILFKQKRPGLYGDIYSMYKFRTMLDTRDNDGLLLDDSARLTKFGLFLRSTSLDELPGLWNVIKGDMSLVGPRPLLIEYLPLYSDEQARRHNVKPGITGWAQVNGRNAISWEQKFIYDVWYVDNQSFLIDVKILLLTVKKVFNRDGINGEGEVTMSKFTGKSS